MIVDLSCPRNSGEKSPLSLPVSKEQRSACGHGNIYTEAVLSLVEIVNVLAAKHSGTYGFFQHLYAFLEMVNVI